MGGGGGVMEQTFSVENYPSTCIPYCNMYNEGVWHVPFGEWGGGSCPLVSGYSYRAVAGSAPVPI